MADYSAVIGRARSQAVEYFAHQLLSDIESVQPLSAQQRLAAARSIGSFQLHHSDFRNALGLTYEQLGDTPVLLPSEEHQYFPPQRQHLSQESQVLSSVPEMPQNEIAYYQGQRASPHLSPQMTHEPRRDMTSLMAMLGTNCKNCTESAIPGTDYCKRCLTRAGTAPVNAIAAFPHPSNMSSAPVPTNMAMINAPVLPLTLVEYTFPNPFGKPVFMDISSQWIFDKPGRGQKRAFLGVHDNGYREPSENECQIARELKFKC